MNIEARYLQIKWKNKNEIESVKENYSSEKLEYIDDDTYFLQLYTYTKIDNLHAQIAFSIDDTNITPTILLNDAGKESLMEVIDPATNKIWWVEKGKWIKEGKYYKSKFLNHVGNSKIFFADTIVNINVQNSSLTQEDMEIIFDNFKNELWKIIYDDKSYSNVSLKSISEGITEEYKSLLKEYISNIDDILKNPKVALKEYLTKENIKNIKPTIKTFLEYITDPAKQYYTSKSKLENYNIQDNQYIYWTFNLVMYILNNNVKYQKYMRDSSEKKLHIYKNKIDEINEILKSNKISVDKNLYHRETEALRSERDYLAQNLKNDIKPTEHNLETEEFEKNIKKDHNNNIYFEVKKSDKPIIHRMYIEHWNKILKSNNKGKYKVKYIGEKHLSDKKTFINFSISEDAILEVDLHDGEDTIVSINKQNTTFYRIKILKKCEKANNKYQCELDKKYLFEKYPKFEGFKSKLTNILCYIKIPKKFLEKQDKFKELIDNNEYFLINTYIYYSFPCKIDNIISVEPLDYDIDITEREKRAKYYEKNGWKRNIDETSLEDIKLKEELQKESDIMTNNYKKMKEKYDNLLNEVELEELNYKLLQLQSIFNKLKITSSSTFPNSMTFIQNHLYSSAYTNFINILNVQNIDTTLLDLIQEFENNVGIYDLPKIYERWCLLLVINTLTTSFKFKAKNTNWINELIKKLYSKENINNILVVELENKDITCNIKVWYEKELISKKRPDIVLEIAYLNLVPYKIVFDAKFHEEADIKRLIYELYYDKNYAEKKLHKDNNYFKDDILNESSENINYGNKVFILHPDINAMKRNNIIINNQKWGEISYYGEGSLFNTEKEKDKDKEKIEKNGDSVIANHRYGAVAIHPKDFSYQTMMQRLIGMCLQYYPYVISEEIPNSWLCISCGNVNIETENSRKKIIENNTKRQRQCKYCDNIVVYSWCYTCGTKIIKNGIFWTYHNTNQENIYDIKCPNCFATLDDYKNLNSFYDTEVDTNEWLERMKNLNKDEIEKENSIAISKAKEIITNILTNKGCKYTNIWNEFHFGNVCDNILNILKTAYTHKEERMEILKALNIPKNYIYSYSKNAGSIPYLKKNGEIVPARPMDIKISKNLIKDTGAKLRIYVSDEDIAIINEDTEKIRNEYYLDKIKNRMSNNFTNNSREYRNNTYILIDEDIPF